ncbi:hypothetical protein E2320_015184, partial [Naja naja]
MALEESQAAEMSALSAVEIQGSPISQNSSAVHYDEASNEEGSEEFRDINRLRQPKTSCRMEVDTGSALSIISWSTLKQLLPRMTKRGLQRCDLTLHDYQGKGIPVLGKG